jgi:hypothetical protein
MPKQENGGRVFSACEKTRTLSLACPSRGISARRSTYGLPGEALIVEKMQSAVFVSLSHNQERVLSTIVSFHLVSLSRPIFIVALFNVAIDN